MKISFVKKLCFAVWLPLLITGMPSLAAITQLNRVSFRDARGPITENWDDSFIDDGVKINISLPKGNDNHRVFTVKQQKQIVFQHPVSFSDESYIMERVRDDASGRIFYVLQTGKTGGYVFGYDPINNVWHTYTAVQDYAPGITYDFSGIELNHGKLELYFQQVSAPYARHTYQLFWDNQANWFGYTDSGLSYQ